MKGVRNPLTGETVNPIPENINQGAGKFVSQASAFAGASIGLEKAKSINLGVRVVIHPTDKPTEIEFTVTKQGSRTISLMDALGYKTDSKQPIFYAGLPSRTVIWMGGTTVDQVKRAVRHEQEVVRSGRTLAKVI